MSELQYPTGDDLGFLESCKTESEILSLSSGGNISIQKYFLRFDSWKGAPIPDTYNGKAIIDWNGEPVFAELAVLRLFQSHGWSGVWVDSYRRKYRTGLPDIAEPIELPHKQRQLVESIRARTGRSGGCWDVLVWKDDFVLFLELKRQKRDRIQKSQMQWLEVALGSGFNPKNFALVEWTIGSEER